MDGPFPLAPNAQEIRFHSVTIGRRPAVTFDWQDHAGTWHPAGKAWPDRAFPPFAEMFRLIRESPDS